jgi:hypothetical protein
VNTASGRNPPNLYRGSILHSGDPIFTDFFLSQTWKIQFPVLPAAPVNNSVKLPVFWPINIVAWSVAEEGIFELQNITSQRPRYFNVFAALSGDHRGVDCRPR